MKQKKIKEDGEHEVVFTVTIAKASFTDKDFDVKRNEIPQVQNYLHCQYKLLPDDKEFVKTDVVTFGMAAKLYCDTDSKVLRTWLEGNKTWVAWTNTRRVRVTKETLIKMFNYEVELKLWDTKDKVSAKARFDRPKAFRLPQTKTQDEVDLDVVRQLLQQEGKTNVHLGTGTLSQSKIFEDVTKSTTKKVSFLKQQSTMGVPPNNSDSTTTSGLVASSESKLEVQVRLDDNRQPQFKNLLSLASSGSKPLAVDFIEPEDDKPVSSLSQRHDRENKNNSRSQKAKSRLDSASSVKRFDAEAEKIRQHGQTSISIPMNILFTNCTTTSNSLCEPVSTLQEVIMIISVNKPLLSERQQEVLNPMVLTVCSASPMPKNLMSFEELEQKCLPPYIKYRFHDCEPHQSEKLKHKKSLKFNDKNVILLGILPKGPLHEYLRGPPLKIEIHDRDPIPKPKKKAMVFGSKPYDNDICSIHYADAVLSEEMESIVQDVSYGVAEFDLSELLQGERLLHLISPIRNCHNKTTNDHVQNIIYKSTKGNGIPPGDYLEFGSELKIKVEAVRSLNEDPKPMVNKESSSILIPIVDKIEECPYNRMVYIFDYSNKTFLGQLLTKVNQINAQALELDVYPQHIIDAALSTYKLSDEQIKDKTLDIITGCQIIDGRYHIFILEGLHDFGLKSLWDHLEHPFPKDDVIFRVLYNSDLSFAERLYLSLDVDLTRVRLYQPISTIVQQPLLYVRDIVPRPCFDAITKLHELCECTNFRNAIRNEMLPTAAMIVSLAKEFGIPLRPDDMHDIVPTALSVENEQCVVEDTEIPLTLKDFRKTKESLDMKNDRYEKMLQERKYVVPKDYVNANIKSLVALAQSKQIEKQMAEEGEKEKISSLINSTPYTGASSTKILRDDLENQKNKWKTKNGFVFPGFKSSNESNMYPIQLHPSRTDELNLPWRENILHGNISTATVDRIYFSWDDRHLNFETLKKPPDFFGKSSIVTIHAAGDTLKEEQESVKRQDDVEWKRKLVVKNPRLQTHRCLPATEMIDTGSKASNQQARLQDILKDIPEKYSLAQKGLLLKSIPAHSVVTQPHVDKNGVYHQMSYPDPHKVLETKHGFHPGELIGQSLNRDSNIIPAKYYDHKYFIDNKGQDFRAMYTIPKSVISKPKPLTAKEKETHLFF